MKRLWISYSWKDNSEHDVDFLAQLLERAGVEVKLDRYVLQAGKRLWPQIEQHICSPDECDAWCIYLTQNSLSSGAVLEEIAYAVDRAVAARGGDFPIIGINPGDVDGNVMPASIRTRLYVSLTDEDWLERVVAGVQNRKPAITRTPVAPFFHRETMVDGVNIIEIRPRAGRWHPAFVAVLEVEAGSFKSIMQGPSGRATLDGMISHGTFEYQNQDGKWNGHVAYHNITPINSLYVGLSNKVSKLIVGSLGENRFDEAYYIFPQLP